MLRLIVLGTICVADVCFGCYLPYISFLMWDLVVYVLMYMTCYLKVVLTTMSCKCSQLIRLEACQQKCNSDYYLLFIWGDYLSEWELLTLNWVRFVLMSWTNITMTCFYLHWRMITYSGGWLLSPWNLTWNFPVYCISTHIVSPRVCWRIPKVLRQSSCCSLSTNTSHLAGGAG